MKKKSIDYFEGLKAIRDNKCPVCGSDRVHYEQHIEDRHYENEDCLDCHAFWTLHYGFTGYGEIGILIDEIPAYEIEIENSLPTMLKWPEILQAVLSQKKILPALIGINDSLDKLIAERLKNGN